MKTNVITANKNKAQTIVVGIGHRVFLLVLWQEESSSGPLVDQGPAPHQQHHRVQVTQDDRDVKGTLTCHGKGGNKVRLCGFKIDVHVVKQKKKSSGNRHKQK